MKIFIILLFSILVSCSFKSKEQPQNPENPAQNGQATQADDSYIQDYDGDMVPDIIEYQKGRNPDIADFPQVRMRFLQNYKVNVKYKSLENGNEGEIEFDTKVHQNEPDFKYRVGDIFIRNESYIASANIGKYSGHSWGTVEEHDLTWVSYPEVDSKFYATKALMYKKYFNQEAFEITDISVSLENSLQLKSNDHFKSIKNPTLNFYYYDYEKESYVLIKSVLVERHFNSGVNETFEVTLDNVPSQLLSENYFQKGEFIISELGDFEIPEMETTYKTLMKSIRLKSIPVVYNTPLESNIYYVGLGGKESQFINITKVLFDGKITVEEDKIKKINQFESNLPDFTYLTELKELDKKGKWFLFTNRVSQHYLDYKFNPRDIISLSYITGDVLAAQTQEKVYSFRDSANSENSESLYPLGNISPNSRVHIQIEPKKVWGEVKNHWKDSISSPGGSCGQNCIRPEFTCWHEFNLFDAIDTTFVFSKNYEWELGQIRFLVNQDEFSLKELVDSKKMSAYWVGERLHLIIPDITKIKLIKEFEENLISLKLNKFQETTFNGVKLANWAGRDWRMCIPGTVNVAGSQGWPLSVESREFGNWAGGVNWSQIKRGDTKTYTRNFSLGISSVISNMFN